MNDKPLQVALLGASLNTGNMGVSALAAATVTSVLAAFPDARVFLLDYNLQPAKYSVSTRHGPVEVELVNIRFSKKFWLRNNIAWLLLAAVLARCVPSRKWRESLLAKNPCFKRLLDADKIVALSGGDSFSDIYGLGRLLYVALPQILALQLNKPLVLLPQTLGPFKGALARLIARYIMRRASVVYCRDRLNVEETGRLLGPRRDKLRFSPDMAFILEPVPPDAGRLADLPPRRAGVPLVGINVSGLLLMGGYGGDNAFGLKPDYARLLHDLIRYFVVEQKAEVLLVAHVFGSHAESDTAACERIFQELQPEYGRRIQWLRGDFNQHEIKYVIGQCDFLLGSRMHACIAALSQCVPAVCLAYSRKFIGVMESIGCSGLVADLNAMGAQDVLAAVDRIYHSRAGWRDFLKGRMPEVRQAVLELFLPEGAAFRSRRPQTPPISKAAVEPAPLFPAANEK